MKKQKLTLPTSAARLFHVCLILIVIAGSGFGQTGADNFAAERERAIRLINEEKYLESLPLFERLAAAEEADAQIFFGLGIATLYRADREKDQAARKRLRAKARGALVQARDMGADSQQLNSILNTINPDGGERGRSDNQAANLAMDEAFAVFAQKDYLKAAESYEKAARLDPALYEAMLYTGNSFYGAKEFDKAGIWFAKAVALDPNREIAHRYWGDALMLGGKDAEAKDKFFDAIVAEPYNQLAWRGLIQFSQARNIGLAHPKIEIPASAAPNSKGGTTITLDDSMLKNDSDGSAAWLAYGITRAAWQNGEFAKKFPSEKTYRHSLAEETAALRSVLAAVKNQNKNIKQLAPSLARLQELEAAGLLEAYILLHRADAGIRRDYESYRQNNRAQLKRYIGEFMMGGKNVSNEKKAVS